MFWIETGFSNDPRVRTNVGKEKRLFQFFFVDLKSTSSDVIYTYLIQTLDSFLTHQNKMRPKYCRIWKEKIGVGTDWFVKEKFDYL